MTSKSNTGFVIWFTGLSGSGKTTIAHILYKRLKELGKKVEILDGDVVRTNLSKGLGFSKEDRDTNIRRIGFVAHLLARNGVAVICAAISPYREIRDENRELIQDFIEVYTQCDMDTLVARDAKGLYKKALAGEIKGFTGVDDPYEEPLNAEVVIETNKTTAEAAADIILKKVTQLGYLDLKERVAKS